MVSFAEIQNSLAALEGRYILHETAFPHGELKADYISIREPNGRLVLGPIPRQTLDRLIREGIVRLDGPYNQQDQLVYRPLI